VGLLLGVLVGSTVGRSDGLLVVFFVGLTVGCSDGLSVGIGVGLLLGVLVPPDGGSVGMHSGKQVS